MRFKDFLAYLEKNLDGYETFIEKAMQFQEVKNQKRPKKSRWESPKMQKAAEEMWQKSMQPLYDSLKREIGSSAEWLWIDYIEKNAILEVVNDGISDMNFDE